MALYKNAYIPLESTQCVLKRIQFAISKENQQIKKSQKRLHWKNNTQAVLSIIIVINMVFVLEQHLYWFGGHLGKKNVTKMVLQLWHWSNVANWVKAGRINYVTVTDGITQVQMT